MKFAKVLNLSAIIALSLNSHAIAMDSDYKIKGTLDFSAIHYKTNGAKNQQKFSTYQNSYGFITNGAIYAEYALVGDDLKYGAKIGLEHTSKNARNAPFSLYVENSYGKLEGGSESAAGNKMKITGYAASCENAGSWDTYIIPSPDKNKLAYVTNFCSFLDSKMRVAGKTEYSRKVTYYTPKFDLPYESSLQLGVSYVPDSSNMGIGDVKDEYLHTPVGASSYSFAIKDGISYGVSYEKTFSDDLKIKTSVAGEVGKVEAYDKTTKVKSDIKFKDLNNIVYGAEVKFASWAFAASYGNYGQSLSSSEVDKIGRNTHLVSLGAKYVMDSWSFNLNHFFSEHKKNKINATTAGVEYNIFKGLKTYLQTTYYATNGRYMDDDRKLMFDKSKGTLIIVGSKISF